MKQYHKDKYDPAEIDAVATGLSTATQALYFGSRRGRKERKHTRKQRSPFWFKCI